MSHTVSGRESTLLSAYQAKQILAAICALRCMHLAVYTKAADMPLDKHSRCLSSSASVTANTLPMWPKSTYWAQHVAILGVLGYLQGAITCEYFISTGREGATLCMGGCRSTDYLSQKCHIFHNVSRKFGASGATGIPHNNGQ